MALSLWPVWFECECVFVCECALQWELPWTCALLGWGRSGLTESSTAPSGRSGRVSSIFVNSPSVDWGVLSMREAVRAFWYCCLVTCGQQEGREAFGWQEEPWKRREEKEKKKREQKVRGGNMCRTWILTLSTNTYKIKRISDHPIGSVGPIQTLM